MSPYSIEGIKNGSVEVLKGDQGKNGPFEQNRRIKLRSCFSIAKTAS